MDSSFYSYLFSGSSDNSLRFWHCSKFAPRTIQSDQDNVDTEYESQLSIKLHRKPVLSVCYMSRSSLILSGGADNKLTAYNVEKREIVRSFGRMHKGRVNSILQISESQIATGCGDKKLRLIDLEQGVEMFCNENEQ